MNDEQIEKYREIIADAPEGATGMALKIDAFDYIKLDMEEGCLLFWWDDGFFLVETSELFEYQSFESLANLRTMISQHERIAELERGWISVEDRLPSLHERALCLLKGEPIVLELKETFTAFLYWHEPYDEMMVIEWYEVTHWIPLPEPPKGSE